MLFDCLQRLWCSTKAAKHGGAIPSQLASQG